MEHHHVYLGGGHLHVDYVVDYATQTRVLYTGCADSSCADIENSKHTSAATDDPKADRKAFVELYKAAKGAGITAAAEDVSTTQPPVCSFIVVILQPSCCLNVICRSSLPRGAREHGFFFATQPAVPIVTNLHCHESPFRTKYMW